MAKLLVIDDEEDVRAFVKNFFTKRGLEILLASSGDEAIKIISNQNVDLILLDMRMDGLTGLETMTQLRHYQPMVKIVIVSAVIDEEVSEQARALGVTGICHKPLMLEELERIVMMELDRAHVGNQN